MVKLVIELAPREMKNVKLLVMILLIGLFCMSNTLYAGNGDLTVGGTLEMTSNANGFLPPRMTTSARGNLTPSPGMLIYNTDDNAYNYYTGSGWQVLASSLPIHDNTGASVDYALAVGETAKISYTSAISVPLHIQLSEGIYQLFWIQPYTTGISPDGGALLKPNNTTVSAGAIVFSESRMDYSPTQSGGAGPWVGWRDGTGLTAFSVGYNYTLAADFTIFTFKSSKYINGHIQRISNPSSPIIQAYSIFETWKDTTTVWSSLGTLVFPYAQSGVVFVRRIA